MTNHFAALRRPLLLLLPLLLFAAPANPQQNPVRCDACNKLIQGTYKIFTKPGGTRVNLCPRCDRNLARCIGCGIPVQAPRGQQMACPSCQGTMKQCSICKGVIRSRYEEYSRGDKTQLVCADCSRSMPRCSSCKVPKHPSWLKDIPAANQKWCAACLAESHNCDVCSLPVLGRFYSPEFQEERYCARCFEGNPQCDLCSAPMPGEKTSLADGRTICPRCTATSISGTKAIETIATQMRPTFEELLGRKAPPVPIRAVDLRTLRARSAGSRYIPGEGLSNGLVQELGLFSKIGDRSEILILDSLPEDLMWETVAHELAHAWMFTYYPEVTDMMLVEGFAQWVAERVCYRHFRRRGIEALRNRSDFYGHAYRYIAALETQGGVPAILAALEKNEVPEESHW